MTTPGKPRQSGIPGPQGRLSSIPTPGRSRSTSSVYQNPSYSIDADDISRAFADAIKANDPAQHRVGQSFTSLSSLSSQNAIIQNGRRSVAGRPSSAASSSSTPAAVHRSYERAKTPISARSQSRPPSRHSDVFNKSVGSKAFEVGDNVRIESLGYEGTLRFLGEIDGKLGLWAGVELSGGFSGKGKNNGSVSGKQYFNCPENCGVFVATSKLSPPTVGIGATSRPSSVASSRGGRVTPGLTGRTTPSFSSSISKLPGTTSSGRITPSNVGRITPSLGNGRITPGTTPSANSRIRAASKVVTGKSPSSSLADKITAGSRAAKYMSMTAQQLSSRDASSKTTQNGNQGSPVAPSLNLYRNIPSPTRPSGSPFTTPKPMLPGRTSTPGGTSGVLMSPNRPRSTVNTPRARIPSNVAMPPPPSPISASASSGSYDFLKQSDELSFSVTDPDHADKVSRENIHSLNTTTASKAHSSRPSSSASMPSEDPGLVELLQSRLQALEYENERLRSAAETTSPDTDLVSQVEQLKIERDDSKSRVTLLEERLATAEQSVASQNISLASLEDRCKQVTKELETIKYERQQEVTSLKEHNALADAQLRELQEAIAKHEELASENNVLLESKELEIGRLQSEIRDAQINLEEERTELGSQIDELRIAGQETIALYEERLSTANGQRYELESRIASLEAAGRTANSALSTSKQLASSAAAEIDNETLRDQIVHLQKKISTMEDIIEDAHATSEKEEAAFRERMRRLKEKEEFMKKELAEGKKEVERMTKSEASARSRIEEIEEAFRESAVALENARAEVEALRTEIANIDGLVGDDGTGDLSSRISEFAQRAASDRKRYEEDVQRLQIVLGEYRAKDKTAVPDRGSEIALRDLQSAVTDLNALNHDLQERNNLLEGKLLHLNQELEATKKKSNRDVPITNGLHELNHKHDFSVAREEITGLKHIVQELQKENAASTQRIKFLESENQLLSSEAEQLRQEVNILEDNLDNNLTGSDDANAKNPSTVGESDIGTLQKMLLDQKMRFETELDQIRKRLSDSEMKHARTAHDLNKEISELETLVESKIYREDELEQEVERLKEKLARQKKSSKTSIETTDNRQRVTSMSSTYSSDVSGENVCEICERPGHDIFNCNLLKDDTGMSDSQASHRSSQLFCEDCEGHGHVAADCPHSLDVF